MLETWAAALAVNSCHPRTASTPPCEGQSHFLRSFPVATCRSLPSSSLPRCTLCSAKPRVQLPPEHSYSASPASGRGRGGGGLQSLLPIGLRLSVSLFPLAEFYLTPSESRAHVPPKPRDGRRRQPPDRVDSCIPVAADNNLHGCHGPLTAALPTQPPLLPSPVHLPPSLFLPPSLLQLLPPTLSFATTTTPHFYVLITHPRRARATSSDYSLRRSRLRRTTLPTTLLHTHDHKMSADS